MLYVQSHYTGLLGILVTFCFKGVLAQWTQSNARVVCFLLLVMPQNVSRGGMGGTLNSPSVRVQRFMSIWHSNIQPRSGTD